MPKFTLSLLLFAVISIGNLYGQVKVGNNIYTTDDNFGRHMRLSADGNRLMATSHSYFGDSTYIRVYELISGEWIQIGSTIHTNIAPAKAMMTDDGNRICVRYVNNDTGQHWLASFYWQPGTGWVKYPDEILRGSNFYISEVEISPDGNYLAHSYFNNDLSEVAMYKWNVDKWEWDGSITPGMLNVFAIEGTDLALSNDPPRVAVSLGSYSQIVLLERLGSGWTLYLDPIEHGNSGNDDLEEVQISHDGDRVMHTHAGNAHTYEWNGVEWDEIGFPGISEVRYIALSASGNQMVRGYRELNSPTYALMQAYEWSGEEWIENGNLVEEGIGYFFGAPVAISADGKRVAMSVDGEKYVCVYEYMLGVSTEEEPTATQVKDLSTAIREKSIPTIFAELTADDRVLKTVADEAGVTISEKVLLADGLGEAGTPEGTYTGMLVYNTCAIVEGLGGECAPEPS